MKGNRDWPNTCAVVIKPHHVETKHLPCLAFVVFAGAVATLHGGEWRIENGIEVLHFDTPLLSGILVARDTRKLGRGLRKAHGLRDVVFKPTGFYLNAPYPFFRVVVKYGGGITVDVCLGHAEEVELVSRSQDFYFDPAP